MQRFLIGNLAEDGLSYTSVLVGFSSTDHAFYAVEFGGADLFKGGMAKETPRLAPNGGPHDYLCALADHLHYGRDAGDFNPRHPLPEVILPEVMLAFLSFFDPGKSCIDLWLKCAFQHVERDERYGMESCQGVNPFLHQKARC